MTFIPEPEYKELIKKMPIFCGDFLIFAEKKYLLIKRKEEPVKDVYWVVGGRFCLLYTSPSPRDRTRSRMPSSA